MSHSRCLMILTALFFCLLAVSCGDKRKEDPNVIELNFGHFPNVTHVQGLVAHHFSREGKGWFEARLREATGKDVRINWYVYNAGPSAMEAVFARSIELAYVGPSPAINAFVRSRGEDIRMIAGAVEGGAALVVPKDSPLKEPADFHGRVIATPQLGNTQDVSARAWISSGGLHVTQRGGDVTILPTPNPEQLSLFRQGKLDGVWTVEPWVSRLVMTAGGKVLVDERESIATVLVCGAEFLQDRPEVVKALVQAHQELNEWIRLHPEEAQAIVVRELEELTRSKIDPALIAQAWKSIVMKDKISLPKLQQFVQDAHHAGFMKEVPDVAGLVVPEAVEGPLAEEEQLTMMKEAAGK
ncbi:ABC transporter substrate-binding protein [uncultured Akkermansia sp.]|uniref:ABC transporter substrate-binding protein n=1 Tax=uncultured Akkermansia sp. TaxID=512294 RepID=UPI0025D1B08C|nr:ABC transporter substrate-binding protein [uncultured Akkermansia sp.]